MRNIPRQIGNLTLRPFTMDDAESLLEIQSYNRSYFEPFMPYRDQNFYSLESQRQLLETDLKRWEADNGYAFAVTLSHALVGRVALSNVVRGAWQNATLGYWIDSRYQGRGIATSAVAGVLKEAFGPLQLHRVQAAIMPHNMGSIAVVLKNGFIYEGLSPFYLQIQGQWESHNIYALTIETYPDSSLERE